MLRIRSSVVSSGPLHVTRQYVSTVLPATSSDNAVIRQAPTADEPDNVYGQYSSANSAIASAGQLEEGKRDLHANAGGDKVG